MVATIVLADTVSETATAARTESFVAQLTRVAYEVALRHRPDRPFTDLELTLWREIQAVVQSTPLGLEAA